MGEKHSQALEWGSVVFGLSEQRTLRQSLPVASSDHPARTTEPKRPREEREESRDESRAKPARTSRCNVLRFTRNYRQNTSGVCFHLCIILEWVIYIDRRRRFSGSVVAQSRQTLLYHLFYSKLGYNLQNKHKRLKTSNWNHKVIRKLFTEVINQVKSRVSAYIQ